MWHFNVNKYLAPNVGEFVAMRRTTTELSYNKPETNKFRNRTINEIRKESSSSAKKKSRQYCNCNRKPPLSRKNREKTNFFLVFVFSTNSHNLYPIIIFFFHFIFIMMIMIIKDWARKRSKCIFLFLKTIHTYINLRLEKNLNLN